MSAPTPSTARIDVLILGGGIAGLWTLARLTSAGYSCLLVEANVLGAGQTIASQGIIHGGVKYALTGATSRASRAVADMPARWRACLRGEGEVDLRGVTLLADRQYLWTTAGIGSRLAGLAAGKVIRTTVEPVAAPDRPEALRHAPAGVDVYGVAEPVLDPRALLLRLAEILSPHIAFADGPDAIGFPGAPDQPVTARLRHVPPDLVSIYASHMVLAAGEANADLFDKAAYAGPAPSAASSTARMQRRPLHMVMLRADNLPPLCGHCIGFSDKPRVTITSQRDARGRTVWYVGGQIAETGVKRDRDAQIVAAKLELGACLPWIDLSRAQWATLRIDRAEGLTDDASRPDTHVVVTRGRVTAVWPTKLALAPAAASEVLGQLQQTGLEPAPQRGTALPLPSALGGPVCIADLPWEDRSIRWT